MQFVDPDRIEQSDHVQAASFVMVSSDIIKDGLSECKVGPYAVCSLRVKANLFLCVQCGNLIDGRCAGMRKVIVKFS